MFLINVSVSFCFLHADIKNQRDKLRKNKQKLNEFLCSPFIPPPAVTKKRNAPAAESRTVSPSPKKPLFEAFQNDVGRLTSDGLVNDFSLLQQRNQELEHENEELKEANKRLVAENNRLKREVILYTPGRMNQFIKRKDKSIQLWKQKHSGLKKTSAFAVLTEKRLRETQKTLQALQDAKKKQAVRMKQKILKLEQQLCVEKSRVSMEAKNARKELEYLENELKWAMPFK